jgi:hypothetical protein
MTEEKKKRDLGFKLEDLLKEGERAATAMGTVIGTSPDLAKRNSVASSSDGSERISSDENSPTSEPKPECTPSRKLTSPALPAKAAKGRPRQDPRHPDQVCRTVLYLSEDVLQIAKIKAIEGKTRPSVVIDALLRRTWLG